MWQLAFWACIKLKQSRSEMISSLPWEPLPPYQKTVLGTAHRVCNPRPEHGLWSQIVLIRGQGLITRHLFVAQTSQCQIIKESFNLPSQTIAYWESQGRKRQLYLEGNKWTFSFPGLRKPPLFLPLGWWWESPDCLSAILSSIQRWDASADTPCCLKQSLKLVLTRCRRRCIW